MKTEGISAQEFENQPGASGTLFRNVRRADVGPPTMLRQLAEHLHAHMAPQNLMSARNKPLLGVLEVGMSDIQRALPRGQEEVDRVANLWLASAPGDWELFTATMPDDEQAWPQAFWDTYVHIEKACREANAALAEGQFGHAAELIADNERLRVYWGEEHLHSLACAQTVEQTLRARAHAWLELEISILARWSLQSPKAAAAERMSGPVRAFFEADVLRPGSHWLQCAKAFTTAVSLRDLRKRLLGGHPDEYLPSLTTLKRWSCGAVFPQRDEKLTRFGQRVAERAHVDHPALRSDEVADVLLTLYLVARRLDTAAWIVQSHPAQRLRHSFDRWREHGRDLA